MSQKESAVSLGLVVSVVFITVVALSIVLRILMGDTIEEIAINKVEYLILFGASLAVWIICKISARSIDKAYGINRKELLREQHKNYMRTSQYCKCSNTYTNTDSKESYHPNVHGCISCAKRNSGCRIHDANICGSYEPQYYK